MKKLLYIFLTVLIVGCSGEDGGNNSNNNSNNSNNVDYFFEVEFGGVINRVQGNTSNTNSWSVKNRCYTGIAPQWATSLSISDITDVSYISGQTMNLFLILDDAQLGSNTGVLGNFFGNYIDDYLISIGSYPSTGTNFKENGTGDTGVITNILVTDLGTQPTSTNTGLDYGETLKATYEGVLYFLSLDTGYYDIPAPIRIEFNAVRVN